MGISCCKQVKVTDKSFLRVIADGDQFISWVKGAQLGSGSFATVYKAIDINTATVYAVKCISLSSSKENSNAIIKSMRKEVNILKTLEHPNITKYYQTDLDIEKREFNILIEFASNGSLFSLLKQINMFTLKMIKRFTKEILSALIYIHSREIVHRDLKCSNILLSEDSTIKLSDFGLSRVLEGNVKIFDMAGSLCFMAPEVILNEKPGKPSDIWSLGCCLIEMLTGKSPWAVSAKSTRDVIKCILNLTPVIPDCDPDLKDFIQQCFLRDPSDRPTAEELIKHKIFSDSASALVTFVQNDV